MWKRIERLCEWKRPQAPPVRAMFDDVRATPAVLGFLRNTHVGRMISPRPLGEESGERRAGQARPRMYFSFVYFICFSFPFIHLSGGLGEKEKGVPYFNRLCRSGTRNTVMYKKSTAVAQAAVEPLPWPFGPHVAGY